MDTKSTDFQSMITSFMQNAKKTQENLRQAYQAMTEKNKDRIVIGKAGGELVIAHVNLKMQLIHLELKPEIFEEKHQVVSELIIAAVNQAIFEVQQVVKQEMMSITQKMGLPSEFPLPFNDKS